MLILLPYKESKNTFVGTLSRVKKVLKGRGAPPLPLVLLAPFISWPFLAILNVPKKAGVGLSSILGSARFVSNIMLYLAVKLSC